MTRVRVELSYLDVTLACESERAFGAIAILPPLYRLKCFPPPLNVENSPFCSPSLVNKNVQFALPPSKSKIFLKFPKEECIKAGKNIAEKFVGRFALITQKAVPLILYSILELPIITNIQFQTIAEKMLCCLRGYGKNANFLHLKLFSEKIN